MTLAVLIIAAALGATVTRNRLAGVLMVGVTGYGCGTVFVFHGAPDLALTQFLVETMTLVIFVLVLRALPASTERATMLHRRGPRAALAVAVGLAVAVLAAFAMAARDGVGVAALLADAAYTRGHGSNTVNVLLVDIRAWDTLGEISVLLVAATGVASWCSGIAVSGWPRGCRPRPRSSPNPPSTAPRSDPPPGCAAAATATPGNARWCWR